jgi:hypothetical protein
MPPAHRLPLRHPHPMSLALDDDRESKLALITRRMLKAAPMIQPVKSPPTRVLSKGRATPWLLVLLAFAALVFAPVAQASGTDTSDTATEAAEQAPSTAEEPTPVAEQAPPAVAEAAPPATETAPSAYEQTPPAAEAAPPKAEAAPPATEQPPPIAEPAPPAAEPTPPIADPAPPVAEPTPPVVEPAPPVAEPTPPAEKDTPEQTAEQTPGGTSTGADSEGLAQRTGGGSQESAGSSGPTRDAASEATPEASIAVSASTTPSVPLEIPAVHDQPARASSSRAASARCARQAGCEPAAIGASITAEEAGGWLDLAVAASGSTAKFAAAGPSRTAIAAGMPAGNRGGRSAAENHPSAPTPGPGPGGAGGGSAAGGASGSASSASFTLVSVLLHAAPRALRRFRLAQPSWRTSFFVLIPERPD